MLTQLKKIIAKTITSEFIGFLVERITKNKIQFRGIQVDTHFSAIDRYVKSCIFWGLYEKQEAIFIQKYLNGRFPVIELGASIGVVSSIIGKLVSPQKVYCFEANPHLIEIIQNNLRLNNLTNVVVENIGIGDGPLYFTQGENNTVGKVTDMMTQDAESIRCASLRDLVRELGVTEYALVCDIEGAETSFIFDEEALKHCRFMVIELHDTQLGGKPIKVNEMITQIEKAGFSIIEINGVVLAAQKL